MQGKQKPRSNKKGCESCETVKSIRNSSSIKKNIQNIFINTEKVSPLNKKLK